MLSPTAGRVQLVISGKFFALLLVAMALLGTGYYQYTRQQQASTLQKAIEKRFETPPYFVNRGSSVVRSCQQCLQLGKLKPQAEWRVGIAREIPETERHWFLAVDNPPVPVTVSGVLMLPVYGSLGDNPALGFDQTRVVLVLFQNLERRQWIEQSASPPPSLQAPAQSQRSPAGPEMVAESADQGSSPLTTATAMPVRSPFVGDWRNIDSTTISVTRLLIVSDGGKLVVHPWAKCVPVECDWGTASVEPQPASKHLLIVWDHKYAYHNLDAFLESGGRLRVAVQTRYIDKSNHVDMEVVSYFISTATP